jgi:hypothetical protein
MTALGGGGGRSATHQAEESAGFLGEYRRRLARSRASSADLVGVDDVGCLAVVAPTAAVWLAESSGFPAPIGRLGTDRIWIRNVVDHWLQNRECRDGELG